MHTDTRIIPSAQWRRDEREIKTQPLNGDDVGLGRARWAHLDNNHPSSCEREREEVNDCLFTRSLLPKYQSPCYCSDDRFPIHAVVKHCAFFFSPSQTRMELLVSPMVSLYLISAGIFPRKERKSAFLTLFFNFIILSILLLLAFLCSSHVMWREVRWGWRTWGGFFYYRIVLHVLEFLAL